MSKMTAAQFLAAHGKGTTREKGKRGNKFGAVKERLDGITFDSKHEAKRYSVLMQLQRAGIIENLETQVAIPLLGRDGPLLGENGRPLRYIADFKYRDPDTGADVIEDAKGHKTRDYKLKKAILAAQGVEIIEV